MRIISFSKKWGKLNQPEFTTFRYRRKDAELGRDWHLGETVQVYYKNRTPEREKLGEAEIIAKEIKQCQMISEDEARADGFDEVSEMMEFLKSPYSFTLISKLTLRWIPKIICLCGSTRFGDAFRQAQLELTLAGKIVLTIGCNMKSDNDIFGHLPEQELRKIKTRLDELHLRKIDLADEVMILNVGGYIGESTQKELDYALSLRKPVKYLDAHTKDQLKGEG